MSIAIIALYFIVFRKYYRPNRGYIQGYNIPLETTNLITICFIKHNSGYCYAMEILWGIFTVAGEYCANPE